MSSIDKKSNFTNRKVFDNTKVQEMANSQVDVKTDPRKVIWIQFSLQHFFNLIHFS